MRFSYLVALGLQASTCVFGAPAPSLDDRAAGTATVVIPSPAATVLGNIMNKVESFGGIPYAEPPIGPLRMRPPKRLTRSLGTFDGTGPAGACPQFVSSTESKDFLFDVLGSIANLPFVQNVTGQSEDCLTITVARPEGTKANAKLPVLYWIFGGGFELGWSSMYDGTGLVNYGVEIGKPFIFVAVNYRVAGFGFMPGKEIQAEGAGNAGLLDQRMGLEWVADNIASFGGDPEKVSIWGESAGSISVFAQMALFDGDHHYKGKPLFRGAIMSSGSIIPTKPLDSTRGQAVYDQVVKAGGCSTAANTLDCLRKLSYNDFLNAANSVPHLLSYNSLALSYLPRPDGRTLTASPDELVLSGKYAAVPMIVGNMEDEGTLFALFQSDLITSDRLATYLKQYYFADITTAKLKALISTYGEGLSAVIEGSPFGSGILNEVFPGFKRRAAILGDLVFTLSRRLFLITTAGINAETPSWSYLMSQNEGTPVLGTFHGSDLLQVFYGIKDNYAAKSMRSYFINFVHSLDPNGDGTTGFPNWPRWADDHKLANVFAQRSQLINDDFRPLYWDMFIVVLSAPNTKPVISPAFDFYGRVENGLANNLHPTQSNWDQWGAGWTVADCKAFAQRHGYNPADFEIFNVRYTDCDVAWIMCRHRASTKSQIDMIDIFGRLPLGMREFVRHVAVVPNIGTGAAAYTTGDSILFNDNYLNNHVMVHEAGHSLDSHGRRDITTSGFSSHAIWRDNYNQDSAVVSAYARTSWAENFAETAIIAVYDKVVPGGIGGIQPNWNAIFHQYATLQGFMGNAIIPRSKAKCTTRLQNSQTVAMRDGARIAGPQPDTFINGTQIEVLQGNTFGDDIHVFPKPQ
ncbi:Lipase-like protein [Paramyrothecium foliicola]|nr:Lipase-like protein [Paramyrothecium foliicola]